MSSVYNDMRAPHPFCYAPFSPNFHYKRKLFGTYVNQASLHADNWLALEAGKFPFSCSEAKDAVYEAEVLRWGKVFSAQKWTELRRLQHAVATGKARYVHSVSEVKFLGCVMEIVRNSLGFFTDEASYSTESESCDEGHTDQSSLARSSDAVDNREVDWTPSIAHERFPVLCSQQLNAALQEAISEVRSEVENGTQKMQLRSLQMRVLWEIQRSLLESGGKGPECPDFNDAMYAWISIASHFQS